MSKARRWVSLDQALISLQNDIWTRNAHDCKEARDVHFKPSILLEHTRTMSASPCSPAPTNTGARGFCAEVQRRFSPYPMNPGASRAQIQPVSFICRWTSVNLRRNATNMLYSHRILTNEGEMSMTMRTTITMMTSRRVRDFRSSPFTVSSASSRWAKLPQDRDFPVAWHALLPRMPLYSAPPLHLKQWRAKKNSHLLILSEHCYLLLSQAMDLLKLHSSILWRHIILILTCCGRFWLVCPFFFDFLNLI